MRQRVIGVVAAVLALGAIASAQEPDETATRERREIRVLRDPYDLASFYRSDPRPYFTYDVPPYGSYPTEAGLYSRLRARHPIAGFYRQGGGAHYSRFWQSGYGARPVLGPGVYGPAYRETIGENGDLYLFAPFLAPMGPLAGAYHRSLARPLESPRE
jgi:hypothetical protein